MEFISQDGNGESRAATDSTANDYTIATPLMDVAIPLLSNPFSRKNTHSGETLKIPENLQRFRRKSKDPAGNAKILQKIGLSGQ